MGSSLLPVVDLFPFWYRKYLIPSNWMEMKKGADSAVFWQDPCLLISLAHVTL